MPVGIAMPRLGLTMREGTVVDWRLRPGEPVRRGETLLVIESEKAEVEVDAPASGVLRHIYVEAGATVACGTLLAALTENEQQPFDPDAFRRQQGERPAPAPPSQEIATGARTAPRAGRPGAIPVTPAARRRARELDVDLARVRGSGPGGRIVREDVETFAQRIAGRRRVAKGVALEVQSAGEGPPVLLLPGFGTDWTAFARQLPALAERYRAIAVNLRGVGVSDPPAGEVYPVDTAARDALALAESEPAHWIGASWGAAVVLELALRRPEAVRSLTLITPFVSVDGRLDAVLDAWCRLAEEAAPEAVAAALLPWLFSASSLARPERRHQMLRGLSEIVPRVPAATLRSMAAGIRAWSGTRQAELRGLSVRTLVIAGAEDLLTPGAEQLAESVAGAQRAVIPEAGHAVALEAAEAVNRAILQHLAAHASRGGSSRPGCHS